MSSLKKLLKLKPLSKIETSLGSLHLYPLTAGASIELSKINREEINEIKPEKYVRNFIRMVCFPESTLIDGKEKPGYYPLSESEVMSLTLDEVESIAKEIVFNNEYLYKEIIKVKGDKDEGDSPDDDIIHPMKDDERYIEYLYRLQVIQSEKHEEMMKEFRSSVINQSSFSEGLSNNIADTLTLGASLTDTLSRVDRLTSNIAGMTSPIGDVFKSNHVLGNSALFQQVKDIEKLNIPKPEVIAPDYGMSNRINELQEQIFDAEKAKEERRIKPLNDLGRKLDSLVDTSNKTGEFIVEMNKTQTQVANEIKRSGDESSDLARESIKVSEKGVKVSEESKNLNYIVIVISLLALLLTAFGLWYSYYSNNQSSMSSQKELQLISGGLNSMSAEFSNLSKSLSSNVEQNKRLLLGTIESINEKNRLQQQDYEEQIKQQQAQSDELKEIIKSQGEKLAVLEQKLATASSPKLVTN